MIVDQLTLAMAHVRLCRPLASVPFQVVRQCMHISHLDRLATGLDHLLTLLVVVSERPVLLDDGLDGRAEIWRHATIRVRSLLSAARREKLG